MKLIVPVVGLVAGVACAHADSKTAAKKTVDFVAVRVDAKTYRETRLGTIRFDAQPPYKATLVDGDALRPIVAEMNALDHVMSAGLISSPPSRVARSSDDFFRIMRFGWLREHHAIRLRFPGKQPAATRSFRAIAFEDGKRDVVLGTVEIDDMGYIAIVGGANAHRARLGAIVDDANGRDGESVRVPPPNGERGSWFRSIDRGTLGFAAMQRDRLYEREDILLVPDGRMRPETVAIAGELGIGGSGYWIAAHVPAGMSSSRSAPLRLSGPPGGPLGVTVTKYEGIAYTANALADHVTRAHGNEPGFAITAAGDVEIAGRTLLAVAYQSGAGPARAAHLVVLWPQVHRHHGSDETGDSGVLVDLMTGGPPNATRILAHPSIAVVADSLFVDFDAAP